MFNAIGIDFFVKSYYKLATLLKRVSGWFGIVRSRKSAHEEYRKGDQSYDQSLGTAAW